MTKKEMELMKSMQQQHPALKFKAWFVINNVETSPRDYPSVHDNYAYDVAKALLAWVEAEERVEEVPDTPIDEEWMSSQVQRSTQDVLRYGVTVTAFILPDDYEIRHYSDGAWSLWHDSRGILLPPNMTRRRMLALIAALTPTS